MSALCREPTPELLMLCLLGGSDAEHHASHFSFSTFNFYSVLFQPGFISLFESLSKIITGSFNSPSNILEA